MKNEILNLLRENEPLRPGEIAQKLDVDQKEVSKVIAKLKEDKLVYSPKRCYYTAD